MIWRPSAARQQTHRNEQRGRRVHANHPWLEEHDPRHHISLPVPAARNGDALLFETDPREMETPGCRDARVRGERSSRRYDMAMQAGRDLWEYSFVLEDKIEIYSVKAW